ncbi:hypothetical protein EN858_09135 [Mesorhizobium sp. M4B.F.Ca.ET.215.01.1.1]|uniref:hypothetical protein n=4 Tax=Mesorhizobium TaxID=68287 RepID=UPI000FCBABB0|nr:MULTISPECIES: hypothetical protein [unclassified Mesorhizobium]RUW27632.1 hypothetical protein EOA34_04130 [Mesorhizobium sp. M4B.F.Ca.ET.013.02.1.1]RVD45688.1 hypothetical protein EN741_04330 [Mesorhizobium sp. M4B.F.Ca.ET.019.03.1.1]RWF63034.1 MAG: hypothetical protein EOS47_20805 [Mesorhizobium sp.]TGQ14169.1 hypothetical protein EN858_09135 [Mesorhizobium sp. M4B.F.Ca.ET.215.01.1.1]TGQ41697.1 hypothetical protein EN857_08215 [Mesorhizobium sp. M4B.F.Ca.ET.214.01.1.1]
MTDYIDNPNKYQTDNTPVAQAMMRAREAQAEADRAKQGALAAEAAERAKQDEIDRAVELSMSRMNQQLQAQRMGVKTQGAIRSQDVGVVPPMAEVEKTTVKVLGGIEVSFSQAKDMAETGQITQAEFNKAVVDGLAVRGYAAPKSFA